MNFTAYLFGSYFLSGWHFFVPYLVLYVAGRILSLPTSLLRHAFVALHLLHVVGYVTCLIRQRTRLSFGSFLFWLSLFILLYLPGAYLEYPSDPWEHLRRINVWNSVKTIAEHPIWTKFAYFWMWTFIPGAPMEKIRPALDLFSAFFQLLTLYQTSRFAEKIGFPGAWAKLQAVALALLFGTSLFSIRYYAISSTLLSFTAYFALLSIWWDRPPSLVAAVFESTALFALILFNHGQFAVFFLIFAGGRGLVAFYERKPWKKIPYAGACLVALLLAGVTWSAYLLEYHTKEAHLLPPGELSAMGSFRIWSDYSRYRETYGVFGLVGLFGSLFLWRRQKRLVLFTLTPTLLLLYPFTVYLIVKTFHFDVPYRLLFAAPLSLAFVATLRHVFEWKFPEGPIPFLLTAVSVLLFSYPKSYPWRGKLYFQFYAGSPDRSLTHLDALNNWWRARAASGKFCRLYTDDLTEFYFAATNGWDRIGDRLVPIRSYFKIEQPTDMFWFLNNVFYKGNTYCGLLIPDHKLIADLSEDKIGPRSHHWPADRADIRVVSLEIGERVVAPLLSPLWAFAAADFHAIAGRNLRETGKAAWAFPSAWKKTLIAPHYLLIEPAVPMPGEV